MENAEQTQSDNPSSKPLTAPGSLRLAMPCTLPSSPDTAPLKSPVTSPPKILDKVPTDRSSMIPLVDAPLTSEMAISICQTCKARLPTASMTKVSCGHLLCVGCIRRAFDWACIDQMFNPPRCSRPCEAGIPLQAVRHRLTRERLAAYEQALKRYANAASSANIATSAGPSTSKGPSASTRPPTTIGRSVSAGPLTSAGPSRATELSASAVPADPTNPAQKFCAQPSCRRPLPILPDSILKDKLMDVHFPCPDCGSETCLHCGNYRHKGKCSRCNHCSDFAHEGWCRTCDYCGEAVHEGGCVQAEYPSEEVYDEDEYPEHALVGDRAERRRSWHKCPQCLAVVERKGGSFFGSCLCGQVFCFRCSAGAKYCRCAIPGELMEDELYWVLGRRDYHALRQACRDAGQEYKSLLVQHKSVLKHRQQVLANWSRLVAHQISDLNHRVTGKDSIFDLKGKEPVEDDEPKPEDVLKEGWVGRKVEEMLKKVSG